MPVPPKAEKPRPVPKLPSREEKEEALQIIVGLIDTFCQEHLNEEYAVLCRRMVEKLAAIRKMLKVHQLDPAWTLPSRLDSNPMVWMVQVNGFLMDLRHASRELQEMAFNKGLIPYIPADRQ